MWHSIETPLSARGMWHPQAGAGPPWPPSQGMGWPTAIPPLGHAPPHAQPYQRHPYDPSFQNGQHPPHQQWPAGPLTEQRYPMPPQPWQPQGGGWQQHSSAAAAGPEPMVEDEQEEADLSLRAVKDLPLAFQQLYDRFRWARGGPGDAGAMGRMAPVFPCILPPASSCRYFNSVQSSCFAAAYESDVNMLIAAPTGKGWRVRSMLHGAPTVQPGAPL